MAGGLGSSIWASGGPSRSHASRTLSASASMNNLSSQTYFVPPSQSPRRRSPAQNRSPSRNHTPQPRPNHTSHQKHNLAPAQALHRLEQTCLRLRWKSIDLNASYTRTQDPASYNFAPMVAEQNFKVDFYEFYAWIEQALVLLQRIFGVEIYSSAGDAGGGTHAYHHNVLKALSDLDNPLHSVLGKGEVNYALWKAKELRNRWKDAQAGEETPPLGMYDLSWIVVRILNGLEEAYGIARERVRPENLMWADEMNGEEQEQEEGWDWMVEPMDWEA